MITNCMAYLLGNTLHRGLGWRCFDEKGTRIVSTYFRKIRVIDCTVEGFTLCLSANALTL